MALRRGPARRYLKKRSNGLQWCYWKFLSKEDKMKSQDKQKNEEKKKPQKTLKEKRAEKKAKKDSKSDSAE